MRYGFVLPQGDARTAADLAQLAEESGWDGFFVWEAVWAVDAWVALAAAAMTTSRIRLGTLLTPLPWRQPWKLASETATLDQLSGGRLILSVGLGAPDVAAPFGLTTDRRQRVELLDEGLDILTGLWGGQPFRYSGRHYQVEPSERLAAPPLVQQPRIPIWITGAWGYAPSMQRVLRGDGLLPHVRGDDGAWRQPTTTELRSMRAFADQQRPGTPPLEIIVEGTTPGNDRAGARTIVAPLAEAGATWWIEAMWATPDQAAVRQRLQQGPPS